MAKLTFQLILDGWGESLRNATAVVGEFCGPLCMKLPYFLIPDVNMATERVQFAHLQEDSLVHPIAMTDESITSIM